MPIQRPVAVSPYLCEKVLIEEGTRNVSLINTLNRIRVDGFPSSFTSFDVCVTLTDGVGETTVELAILRLDTLDEIYRHARVVSFAGPLQEIMVIFRVRNCIFPVEGRYQISILAESELIALRAFKVSRGPKT